MIHLSFRWTVPLTTHLKHFNWQKTTSACWFLLQSGTRRTQRLSKNDTGMLPVNSLVIWKCCRYGNIDCGSIFRFSKSPGSGNRSGSGPTCSSIFYKLITIHKNFAKVPVLGSCEQPTPAIVSLLREICHMIFFFLHPPPTYKYHITTMLTRILVWVV
jgi:hypothetical protein